MLLALVFVLLVAVSAPLPPLVFAVAAAVTCQAAFQLALLPLVVAICSDLVILGRAAQR
jgi:hypothetical protein